MVFETTPSSGSSADGTSAYQSASADFGLLDDVPPSYDSISGTTAPSEINQPHDVGEAGPSGSGSGQYGHDNQDQHPGRSSSMSGPPWPASMNVFFSGPPNAEPVISRERAEAGPAIETFKTIFPGQTESWDKRLNDPNVLYDFIRVQALKPPTSKVRIFAKHSENAHVTTTDGQARQERVTVTDFDFTIDLTPVYSHADNLNNVHLNVCRAHVPAYRGTHYKTYGSPVAPNAFNSRGAAGASAGNNEVKIWNKWGAFCKERGRAPWANMDDDEEFWLTCAGENRRQDFNVGPRLTSWARPGHGVAPDEEALLQHSADDAVDTPLKQWCEAYCADPGLLKSFVLRKTVWGWDLKNLRTAIERAILSTGYQPRGQGIQIQFVNKDETIIVRPDNWLVYLTCTEPWFAILCITFIYPWIWIWQRCSSRGGAPYEVAIVNYAMKFYPPLPGTFPNETVEQAKHRLPAMFKLHREVPPKPFLHRGPKGVHYLLGRREGEWFRSWEEAIRMGVRMGYQGDLVHHQVNDNEDPPELDGY